MDVLFSRKLSALLAVTLIAGCVSFGGQDSEEEQSSSTVRTVQKVDLQRYMGDWYVIANIPNRIEKNCHDSIETYAMRPDGQIDNLFYCRDSSFNAPLEQRVNTVAMVDNKDTNAEWRVRFFRYVWVKYLIVDLDPEYQWSVIGHPSREYGWVLSRTKSLPPETYAQILDRLRGQGYDTSLFVKVPQRAPATSASAF